MSFQSHAGSIEAVILNRNGLIAAAGFNPTLVRLRQEIRTHLYATRFLRFNPTLVRLRLHMLRLRWWSCQRFQSHAGSIEAVTSRYDVSKTAQGFNPTLVRLRRRRLGWRRSRRISVSIPRWFD